MAKRTLREIVHFTVSGDPSDAAVDREAAALEEAIAEAVERMGLASMSRGEHAVGPLRIVIEQDVETGA